MLRVVIASDPVAGVSAIQASSVMLFNAPYKKDAGQRAAGPCYGVAFRFKNRARRRFGVTASQPLCHGEISLCNGLNILVFSGWFFACWILPAVVVVTLCPDL